MSNELQDKNFLVVEKEDSDQMILDTLAEQDPCGVIRFHIGDEHYAASLFEEDIEEIEKIVSYGVRESNSFLIDVAIVGYISKKYDCQLYVEIPDDAIDHRVNFHVDTFISAKDSMAGVMISIKDKWSKIKPFSRTLKLYRPDMLRYDFERECQMTLRNVDGE